jgi:ethanolamine utilization cobalamin adenosyltransferase
LKGRPRREAAGKESGMMTSLSGDRMVPKTDGRIHFRGKLDSLEAETIEAQGLADFLKEGHYRDALGEVLGCLRGIMAAEVQESPFALPPLFGLSPEELHRQSHTAAAAFGLAGHPLPDYRQGPLAARLNTLRARTRELELCAVQVFGGDERAAGEAPARREDLCLALNRLSSALYWLYCHMVSKQADLKSGRGHTKE